MATTPLASSAPAAASRRIGRFALLRQRGRGAQATVWLAHDPRLDREVALKLLDPGADAAQLEHWLHEARAVSRLGHPNIVPVFEADRAERQPYLVFEYVDGPTLAELRRSRPKWPEREAVQLMLGILDALAAAHAQGIVHRDLKPSNVLLGSDGRPRVMDFGIAARAGHAAAGAEGRIVGTAGYMSPEAARGEAPQPQMDVFAAGMMLAELLAGMPLMRETDPWRAVDRVQREDLRLPGDLRVDETLRGIVQRALARDPRQRYDGAQSMHAALQGWLEPAAAPAPESSNGTLEFLLRRMRHKTDFPALSDAVLRIQRVAGSETANLQALADEILRDVSLTNKLLRLVNSAHYTAATGGPITTVSRAVSLVGFGGIRNMALSVLLLEHMHDKAHAAHLREEFVRALMAGALAAELTPMQRDAEEAFLGSMFQNLGRLLAEYYFPEEVLQIRKLLPGPDAPVAAREAAALRVLGIGLEDLGVGVARAWGLPQVLQQAMRPPAGAVPGRPLPRGAERLRWLGRAANGLTDTLLQARADGADQRLLQAAEAYVPMLGMTAQDIANAAQAARGRVAQITGALGLQLPRSAKARRLLADTAPATDTGASTPGSPPGSTALAPTVVLPRPEAAAELGAPAAGAPSRTAAEGLLADALQQLGSVLDERRQRLNDALQSALAGTHRALGLRSTVLCLRDPQDGTIAGRIGLGAAEPSAFRIRPQASGDVFAALLAKGADLHVADARTVAGKLPTWYRRQVDAGSFVLLPLMLKGAAVGLLYLDKAEPGSLQLGERELELLRALRDQLLSVFERGV